MKMNLKKAQKDFMQNLRDNNRSSATVAAYNKDLDQLVKHLLERSVTSVDEVDIKHLDGFIKELYDAFNLTHKSVSRKINSIKSFYKYLTAQGYITKNPADELKHPKLEPKTPKIFSKVEYMALREVSRKDLKSYAIVELLLQTGIRISELSLLEVAHLDLGESATLFIPKRESQKERIIPLNARARETVKKYLDERMQKDSPYLFSTKSGKAMLIRNIRSSIDRIFKRAGLENAKVNDFRHTFTAHQLMMGVSIQTVCRVAGHKTMATTQKYLKYVNIDKAGKKEVLEEL
jgi:site-specific recombinase XerD